MNYDFNFAVIWRNWDVLLKGLGLGLYLALAALCIGAVIGLIAAFWSLSPRAWLRSRLRGACSRVIVPIRRHYDRVV